MSSVSIYYACLTNPRQLHSFSHDSLLKEGLHFPGIPFSYFWIPAWVKKKKQNNLSEGRTLILVLTKVIYLKKNLLFCNGEHSNSTLTKFIKCLAYTMVSQDGYDIDLGNTV